MPRGLCVSRLGEGLATGGVSPVCGVGVGDGDGMLLVGRRRVGVCGVCALGGAWDGDVEARAVVVDWEMAMLVHCVIRLCNG